MVGGFAERCQFRNSLHPQQVNGNLKGLRGLSAPRPAIPIEFGGNARADITEFICVHFGHTSQVTPLATVIPQLEDAPTGDREV